MAIIQLNSTDSGATSLTTINDNFTDLDTDKIETSVISTFQLAQEMFARGFTIENISLENSDSSK